jgi:hypothetical protein
MLFNQKQRLSADWNRSRKYLYVRFKNIPITGPNYIPGCCHAKVSTHIL